MTTPQLPERPNLEQLKHQAKDLLAAARAKVPAALARFRALPALAKQSGTELARHNFALHDAQSVIAREFGFVSWIALRERIEELTLQSAAAIDEFVRCSTDHRFARAQRLLAQHPDMPTTNFHAALVAGDVGAVRSYLVHNAALATQAGGPREWEPLHYVAHSHWSAGRSARLLDTAQLLLTHGANPNATHGWRDDPKVKLPALWAALCESRHLALGRLLLEAGANPNDGESVYHAAEHGDIPALELLAAHGARADGGTGGETWNNTPLYFILGHYAGHRHDADVRRGAQWLIEHGANPNRVCSDVRETPLHAAARHWDGAMVDLLLAHRADVHARRGDGRTALTLALLNGRASAADALRAAGAVDELSREERFLAACYAGNRAEALTLREPEFISKYANALSEAVSHASATPVETMLACGFDPGATGCMGETALHWAAFVGNATATRLLIAHGAKVDTRDRQYKAEPLGWCDHASSSGQGGPQPDFGGVARALLAAGAPLPTDDELEQFGSDEVKTAVAEFMRGRPSSR